MQMTDEYSSICETMQKLAFIKKMPNGKYRVLSEKGKNLGTYSSRALAKKRLSQIEWFKHKDKNSADESVIDLTKAEAFVFSAIMRQLNKNATPEQVLEFLKLHKKAFDQAIIKKLQDPDRVALQNAMVQFGKNHQVTLNEDLIKSAAISELGDAGEVGKYLSNIIRFTLTRISEKNRFKAIETVREKLYYLNANDIANKKMPASSSMGQAITFVKHVLFNHDPNYIREVLNNIARNLG